MESKERRLSYSTAFKIEVVDFAEKHGNRATEGVLAHLQKKR